MVATNGIIGNAMMIGPKNYGTQTDPNAPNASIATNTAPPSPAASTPGPDNSNSAPTGITSGNIPDYTAQLNAYSGASSSPATNQPNRVAIGAPNAMQPASPSPKPTPTPTPAPITGLPTGDLPNSTPSDNPVVAPVVQPLKPSTYNAATLGAATQLNVSPNQTVAGQLAQNIDPNSPIIQAARTGALQQMNGRGMLNSSMATTAGDEAAYAAAIPIATTDAGVYNNAAATNTASANAFAQQNANMQNTAGQFNAAAANTAQAQVLAANTQLQNTAMQTNSAQDIAKLNSNTQQIVAKLNINEQTQLQTMNDTEKNLIQNNATAATAYGTYAQVLYNNSISTMDRQAKYDADLTAFNAYKQQMSVAANQMHVPDLSAQLNFNEINPATGSAPNQPATNQ
jgi:hypothetical protein